MTEQPTLNKGSFERKGSVSYFMLYLRDLFYNCPVGGRLEYNNCIPYRQSNKKEAIYWIDACGMLYGKCLPVDSRINLTEVCLLV